MNRAARWPLVGRDEELALIAAALGGPSTRCVLLSGAAGVGKTRLAREAAARDRWTVRWAIATEQTRAIPLGALAPLLPGQLPEQIRADPFRMLRWARGRLLETRPHRDLLVIDDAPLLDDMSAGLLQQLVRAEAPTRLLLTARTADLPGWLARLAREDHVEHVRVQELAESDVRTLVESVLDGAADAATHALLWTHSSGNPLWLRQLVGQGIDDGALHRIDNLYRWDGPIGTGDLDQLVASRIGGIPPDEARALELVALGGPLPGGVVRGLGIATEIESLGRRALVEQDGTGRVRTAHPLYGSVTRARLSPLVRGAAEQRLATAFESCGSLTSSDVVRVARWRLDGGDTRDAALMLAGAQRALLIDSALAERFARAACATEPGYASLHVLGRALFDQRRGDEAEHVYQQLLSQPLSGYERLGVTLERAMFRAWVAGDPAGAIAALREAESRSEFASHVAVVTGMRAAVELFRGNPDAALHAALPIALDPAGEPRIRFLAALAVVPSLALIGRVGEALELAAWARESAPDDEFSGPVPYAPTYATAQLEWEYAFALRWAGRIDDAVAAARTSLAQAARAPERHTQSYGLLNAAAGGALLAAGNVGEARGPLRVGAAALRESDANGTVVSCLADLARAEALAHDVATARELLAEAAERTSPGTRLFDASVARARSVAAAMTGDLAAARNEACTGARCARDAGQAVLEAACLHLLVRFEDPQSAHERLTELAGAGDAGLVAIFAAHADAALRGDAADLERVAERFGTAGSQMLAAHTAAASARAHRRAGRDAAANRLAQLSREFSARCPQAPAPLLLVEPVPLTTRERSVVELARRGLTNQQIAESLTVSVRTVESHLQHAYRKLGLQGRADLAVSP